MQVICPRVHIHALLHLAFVMRVTFIVMIRNWPSAGIVRHLLALGKWKYFLFFSFLFLFSNPAPSTTLSSFFTHYLPLIPHSFTFFYPSPLAVFIYFFFLFSPPVCSLVSILAPFYRSLLGRLFSFPSLAYPS